MPSFVRGIFAGAIHDAVLFPYPPTLERRDAGEARVVRRLISDLREMARSGFRHSDLSSAMAAREGTYDRMGENVYEGGGPWADAGSAHGMFMLSAGHRANVVQSGFTTIAGRARGRSLWARREGDRPLW